MQKFLLKVGFVLLAIVANTAYGNEYDDGITAYDAGDYEAAFAAFRIVAEHGNWQAQSYLGDM